MSLSYLKLTALILFISCKGLHSQILINWQGGSNDNWGDVTKWNPSQIPTAVDTVEIGNLNTLNYTLANATISHLRIRAQGKLIVNDPSARLNITNSAKAGIELLLKGSLIIESGTVSISGSGADAILLDDRSTIINRGNLFINNYGGAGIRIDRNSSFDNYSVFNIDQLNLSNSEQGILAIDGEFHNHNTGEMFISTCTTFLKPNLEVKDGFIMTDEGSSFYWKRPCN